MTQIISKSKVITVADLKAIMAYAIGATEGGASSYRMVDAWKAYTGSIESRAKKEPSSSGSGL